MKAIINSKKISTNIVCLIYSTCTNDLVIQAKQASVIESFFIAFCIEFNRIFIADSIAINVLQKHCFIKAKNYFVTTKNKFSDNCLKTNLSINNLFKKMLV